MLIQPNKKVIKPKHSKPETSPKLLQVLKEIQDNDGGTVSYIFIRDRVKIQKGELIGKDYEPIEYQEKSTLHCTINPEIFFKMIEGKKMRRSSQEIIQIFEDTKSDNGASYYIIG